MESRVQLRGGFILLILVGLLLGSTSASATNELFFNEAIEITDAENGLRTVEVDAFGNIYSSRGRPFSTSNFGRLVLGRIKTKCNDQFFVRKTLSVSTNCLQTVKFHSLLGAAWPEFSNV